MIQSNKFLWILTSVFSHLPFSCAQNVTEDSLPSVRSVVKDSNDTSSSKNSSFLDLELIRVIQSKTKLSDDSKWTYDRSISSPKSVIFSVDGSKFYINSLEGYATVVYDAHTLNKLSVIKHSFNKDNANLFLGKESKALSYDFKQHRADYNVFLGKPVESCLSHNGRYLWVTYYRRDWDLSAVFPSAVAIIDTRTDEFVRVIPCGPLPKMIACSPDNKYVAITHWGDNTVALIDISSEDPVEFKYTSHVVIDQLVKNDFTGIVDRDNNCSNCLRGTVFTENSELVLVAKMGGNGIAVIHVTTGKYLGTIIGSYQNVRHLKLVDGNLFLSSNKFGAVQRASLADIFNTPFDKQKQVRYDGWRTAMVGAGARTIDVTKDGNYTFACVNNSSKIVVINNEDMNVIYEINTESFPVGMALSPDNTLLIVTAQGKESTPNTGNAVMIYKANFKVNKF